MRKLRKTTAWISSLLLAASMTACSGQTDSTDNQTGTKQDAQTENNAQTSLSKIDSSAWQYASDDDVYYQIGISYCETPADESVENLAVFVPGAYMKATDNGDGTYTCEMDMSGKINDYTTENAPIVMPIDTPGYSSQAALTEYKDVTDYTKEGFIYVHAGCRGRDSGAPAGITDLKAAVRYIRYNDAELAGDAERIFTFGMSGGGAQSSLMGATGDSSLYDSYLSEIGAVEGVSDAVLGSMCWCPITNLDSADAAYEWMIGTTRSGLSDEEQKISDKLAEAFADYINQAGIKDTEGNVLTLEKSDEGIYQAGSYYDYLKGVIENSLNNFLSDTTFPYDASSSYQGKMGGRGQKGDAPDFKDGEKPDGTKGEAMPSFGDGNGEKTNENQDSEKIFEDRDNIKRNQSSSGISLSSAYETAKDYIDALNQNGEWVTYDSKTNTASIKIIEEFEKVFKSASKKLGVFDQLY